METILTVPVLGQSVEEVRVVAWLTQPGAILRVGDPLAELETDKTTLVWESPEAGTVTELLVAEGSYAPVEAPLLRLSPISAGTSAASPRARRAAQNQGATLAGPGSGPGGRILERDVTPRSSPLARAVAAQTGVDLAAVQGTGPGGKIVADDLTSQGATRVTLTGIRRRIARAMEQSVQEKPHVTLHTRADFTDVLRLRAALLVEFERSYGIRLSPTDLIARACVSALREHPLLNAHIDGDTVTRFARVHLGVAISLGDDGLIVPVLRPVHTERLAALAVERERLTRAARAGTLTSEQIHGATFTLTNLGATGVSHFNPIIPPPQVAILGVGAIEETVIAVQGVPTVRSTAGLSLSFDHRALDGVPAAAFLARVRELLETPYLLLV
jgi:pyruvate dehydrogenase E2 component (dihydrolipoamide acetyltransferase)